MSKRRIFRNNQNYQQTFSQYLNVKFVSVTTDRCYNFIDCFVYLHRWMFNVMEYYNQTYLSNKKMTRRPNRQLQSQSKYKAKISNTRGLRKHSFQYLFRVQRICRNLGSRSSTAIRHTFVYLNKHSLSG